MHVIPIAISGEGLSTRFGWQWQTLLCATKSCKSATCYLLRLAPRWSITWLVSDDFWPWGSKIHENHSIRECYLSQAGLHSLILLHSPNKCSNLFLFRSSNQSMAAKWKFQSHTVERLCPVDIFRKYTISLYSAAICRCSHTAHAC